MRDVGELGESTFKMWTSQAGLVANKANQDKTGWDFFLESTRPLVIQRHTSIALDRDPYPLKCLVQVKSTDKRPGKWSVKLDNWERLVKDPHPAFFLILEFDGQDQGVAPPFGAWSSEMTPTTRRRVVTGQYRASVRSDLHRFRRGAIP
jgi:hypothetical protein